MDKLFISFDTAYNSSESDSFGEQAAIEPLFAALVGCLKDRGVNVVTPPSEWNDYGWYIDVSNNEAKLSCMMQRSDSLLLLVFSNRTLFDRLRGRHYEAELRSLANSVSQAVHDAFGIPRPPVQTEAEFAAG